MTGMALKITTPLQVIVEVADVVSLRAADASGGFGIQPGHVDFLTVLASGVVRWRGAAGPWRYCAVLGGVMLVEAGRAIRIACREAVIGDDLHGLESRIRAQREAQAEAARSKRSEAARLHTRAIRQIMGRMAATGAPPEQTESEIFG
ncbi:MAG: F0F1 ATP synthase subunit epsilon [Oceanibaculum nanhaiense]|nr:F0F1 ATP synthase subunit epsilon [Oceanibaculum nanhaiense]